MMRFLQRLGKSLMLPVACLPIGGILMGIGYWIDPAGWGANSMLALLLIKAGGILIDNMAILFALGVAIGMSKDQEGTSALAAIISWLTVRPCWEPLLFSSSSVLMQPLTLHLAKSTTSLSVSSAV